MQGYGADFYAYLDSFAGRSARCVVPLVAGAMPVASIADFGCGQGAWLQAWSGTGAEIIGLDGDYVDRSRLLIPPHAFLPADLAAPVRLGRRFDLVQSLEVAEHLPLAHAGMFIDTLTSHADAVLFSAAVPGQGGEHHVNEQPLELWRGLFAARGYRAVDLVRPAVLRNAAVQKWYRCNTLLYVNDAGAARLSVQARAHMVPDTEALRTYWPFLDRTRQQVLRTLPLAVVDRLAGLNAALAARRVQSSQALTRR